MVFHYGGRSVSEEDLQSKEELHEDATAFLEHDQK